MGKLIKINAFKIIYFVFILSFNLSAQEASFFETVEFNYVVRENYSSQDVHTSQDLLFFWGEQNNQPWQPWSPSFSQKAYQNKIDTMWYSDCQNDSRYMFPIRELENDKQQMVLLEECQPQFLYSWGNEEKIRDLKEIASVGAWSNQFNASIADGLPNNALYMAMSPVSTYPYGKRLIRFKVKNGVRFVEHADLGDTWVRNCHEVDPGVRENTIDYRYVLIQGPGGLGDVEAYYEFQACSPKVFESWSHDTKENYNEVIRDYFWIRYAETLSKEMLGYYQYRVQGYALLDGEKYEKGEFHYQVTNITRWTKEKLFDTLKHQVLQLEKSNGEIFYQDSEFVNAHYESCKPLWFERY